MEPAAWAPYLLHLLGVPVETDLLASLSPEARKARMIETLFQWQLAGQRAVQHSAHVEAIRSPHAGVGVA